MATDDRDCIACDSRARPGSSLCGPCAAACEEAAVGADYAGELAALDGVTS